MDKFLIRTVDYHVASYLSRTGHMPNAIFMPEFIYEELKKDFERVLGMEYRPENTELGKVCGLDIIVTLDSDKIEPRRIKKIEKEYVINEEDSKGSIL